MYFVDIPICVFSWRISIVIISICTNVVPRSSSFAPRIASCWRFTCCTGFDFPIRPVPRRATNKLSTSSRYERTTEGSVQHARVYSFCSGTCSAAGGGERAGARVVSSDKEVTNCLARRAPGRLCDVLGTKLARRSRPRRGSLPKDDDGSALALRSIVTCEIMRTPSKPDDPTTGEFIDGLPEPREYFLV